MSARFAGDALGHCSSTRDNHAARGCRHIKRWKTLDPLRPTPTMKSGAGFTAIRSRSRRSFAAGATRHAHVHAPVRFEADAPICRRSAWSARTMTDSRASCNHECACRPSPYSRSRCCQAARWPRSCTIRPECSAREPVHLRRVRFASGQSPIRFDVQHRDERSPTNAPSVHYRHTRGRRHDSSARRAGPRSVSECRSCSSRPRGDRCDTHHSSPRTVGVQRYVTTLAMDPNHGHRLPDPVRIERRPAQ